MEQEQDSNPRKSINERPKQQNNVHGRVVRACLGVWCGESRAEQCVRACVCARTRARNHLRTDKASKERKYRPFVTEELYGLWTEEEDELKYSADSLSTPNADPARAPKSAVIVPNGVCKCKALHAGTNSRGWCVALRCVA